MARESIYEVLNEIYSRQGRLSNPLSSPSHKGLSKPHRFKTKVKIANGRLIEVEYNEETKVSEISLQLAEEIKLKSAVDFRLFFISDSNLSRVIDDSESLFKLLNADYNKQELILEESSLSMMGKVRKSIHKIFSKSNKANQVQLEYKKYIFLNTDLEEKELQSDPVKLELFIFQIFEEMQECKYILSSYDYTMFSALNVLLKYEYVKPLELKKVINEAVNEGNQIKMNNIFIRYRLNFLKLIFQIK